MASASSKSSAELVRIGVLANFLETARDLRADMTEEFRSIGLAPSAIEESESLVNVRDIVFLLSAAKRKTNCPHFPILLAERQDVSFLGSVGLLMRTAPNLGEALRKLGMFIHAHAQPASWSVDETEHQERLSFALDPMDLTAEEHKMCAELALAQCYRVMSQIIGDLPEIERVHFACAPPENASVHQRFFKAPVQFNSEFYGFEFAPGSFAKKVLFADNSMHRSVRKHLKENSGSVAPLDRQVQATIRSLLPTHTLSIERVASSFHCNKRTLQRWLKEDYGTTFVALVDEVRFDLARQYLLQSQMSITDLAFAVGFSDATNFSRAFKKFVGCSPREWKKRQHQRAMPE